MEQSKSLAQLMIWKTALYTFAILNWFLYLGLAISSGSFFKKATEQDRLQLAIGKIHEPRTHETQLNLVYSER